jgi:hypothetical protein
MESGMSSAGLCRVGAAVACLVTLGARAGAQGVVSGLVREDSTGRPLAGVDVSIEGSKAQARTDSAGRYAFEAPAGTQIAAFRLPGYHPLRVRVSVKGDTVRADATLVRAISQQLDPVLVNAPKPLASPGRDGFAERRAMGFGNFIDSTALRAREERRVSDVLSELTGVRMWEYRDPGSSIVQLRAISPIRQMTQGFRAGGTIGGTNRSVAAPPSLQCWVSVFFNNSPVYRSDRAGAGEPPDFSRDYSVSSLESIEYYKSAAEVPQQFGGSNANCGALVLWSRR